MQEKTAEIETPSIKVVLIDMDNTITNTALYKNLKEILELTNLADSVLPCDFYIEGSLELIRDLKKAGVKVGIVSHAFLGGYKNIVEESLSKMDIKLDSFVTIDHNTVSKLSKLYPDNLDLRNIFRFYKYIPDRLEKCHLNISEEFGKGNSHLLAEFSFENMGLKKEDYNKIEVITIGDDWTDVMFALHIHDNLIATSSAIHIDAIELSTVKHEDVDDSIKDLAEKSISCEKTTDFQQVRVSIERIFDIRLPKGHFTNYLQERASPVERTISPNL